MREVYKKSIDGAVNKLLVHAYRQGMQVAWDRAEALQPQCGFGSLALCCRDCAAGPCRVNPFAAEPMATICGRDRNHLILHNFNHQVAQGVAALAGLASDFGAPVDQDTWRTINVGTDTMVWNDYKARFAELGRAAMKLLQAIQAEKNRVLGPGQPAVITANMGALRADFPNIVLHGHVPPLTAALICQAAKEANANVAALTGNEISGPLMLPPVSNYDSQELVLLTGVVDVMVVGTQCVMPATLALAAKMGTNIVPAGSVTTAAEAAAVAAAAQKAFDGRRGKAVNIPEQSATVYAGYSAANSPQLIAALKEGYRQGRIRGLVYLGGCGNIDATQDADFVAVAKALLAQGYVVATTGCAGTALAKAGLCTPANGEVVSELKACLPADIPAVLYLGACHDAATFIEMVQAVASSKMPVLALFPSVTHGKVLATAMGFAVSHIPTLINCRQLGLDEAALAALNGPESGMVMAFPAVSQIAAAVAQVAAAGERQ